MPIAYISIHTDLPTSQAEYECAYEGYHRLAVQYDDDFGKHTIQAVFAKVMKSVDQSIQYIAIGENEHGDGKIHMTVHSMPYIKLDAEIAPRILITNVLEDGLPPELNPLARVIYHLVHAGEMKTEDMHPGLFEAVNHVLATAGVPILTVTRSGAADMTPAVGWGELLHGPKH